VKATPKLRFCRFEELVSGDLFIYMHDKGSCVALKVVDPTQNDEPLLFPFGPAFPSGSDGSYLLPRQHVDVISYGKDYVLQLPSGERGWSQSEPAADVLCLLASDSGYFIRANCADRFGEFRPCFIDLKTGSILATDQGLASAFIRPRGPSAIAIEWQLITPEPEPRVIFSQGAAATAIPIRR